MPLIQCPDCGRQISDAAPSCPHCGRPIGRSTPAAKGTVTIEATGKKYKGMQLSGCLTIVLGFIFVAGGQASGFGGFLSLIGIVLLLWGTVGGWWKHG